MTVAAAKGAMVMVGKRWLLAAILAAALSFTGVHPAFAVTRTYVNQGVGSARLGMLDSAVIRIFGRPVARGIDRDYPGQTVYYYYWGRKMANGKYPLEVNSRANHRVFAFTCLSSWYVTAAGIRIGSTESSLQRAYGTVLRRYANRVYTRYALGGRTGTDFYVRAGKVTQILVRSY
jgi:hypothetical protein